MADDDGVASMNDPNTHFQRRCGFPWRRWLSGRR